MPNYLSITNVTEGTIAYLAIKANGTINESYQYSNNGGASWYSLAIGEILAVGYNQTRLFRITSPQTGRSNNDYVYFDISSSGAIDISGNAYSMITPDFDDLTNISEYKYALTRLFNGCTSLNDASGLELPATTLSNWCYAYMFNGCTNILMTPELPANIVANYCYVHMFDGCTSLAEAPELPATTLADSCYAYMFSGCTSLTDAPELPATIAKSNCYKSMFSNCTSLTTASELPATTTNTYCYDGMFDGCTSLATAPSVLPANTAVDFCYNYMFRNCTNLEIAPRILATQVGPYGCRGMFYGCTSLTTATELSATTLAIRGYSDMFRGCTNLYNIPSELNITSLGNFCCDGMFYECTSLKTVPKLPATTLTQNCYAYMFQSCTNIKVSDTKTNDYQIPYRVPTKDIGAGDPSATAYMFANTGGIFKGTPEINTTYYLYGINYLKIKNIEPSNSINVSLVNVGNITDEFEYSSDGVLWGELPFNTNISIAPSEYILVRIKNTVGTRLDTKYVYFTFSGKTSVSGNVYSMITPDFGELTDISSYNYALYSLFKNCNNLIDASELELPATKLGYACYSFMFYGCKKLVATPKLPATVLNSDCYFYMFGNCASLTTTPELSATNLASSCYRAMFLGCESLVTPSALPAETLKSSCYEGMFWNCKSLVEAPELPATTLANGCYVDMFTNCTSLTEAPELPAMIMINNCYIRMFDGCTSLTKPPKLPATTLANSCYAQMFRGCTNIKLSETQTAEYTKPYRVPNSGTGTVGTNSLNDMFTGTGGTFTGTPTINTTYYLYDLLDGVYHWTGTDWKLDGDVSGNSSDIYYQETEPAGASDNDLWIFKD